MKEDGATLCAACWVKVVPSVLMSVLIRRVASHTRPRPRPRARDHYDASSTLVGGKGGDCPSSLHASTLEGPTGVCECARWMLKSTWIPTWHHMGHVAWSLGLCSKTTSWR